MFVWFVLPIVLSGNISGNPEGETRARPSSAIVPLSIRDVGEYAGVPWGEPGQPIKPGSREDRVKDLNLAISSINLSDEMSDEFLEHWADVAKWGKQQGKKLLPRISFWGGAKGSDIDAYWRRLDRFLEGMRKREALNDFYAICLGEENSHRHAFVLGELYRRIKAKYDVPVYQWLGDSTGAEPTLEIPADGWIIDTYEVGGREFRRCAQSFLVTGKPLVVMLWACWYDDEGPWRTELWQYFEDQLQVCREYNLPTAFYWITGYSEKVGGGVAFPMSRDTYMAKINQRIFDWIKEVRSLPADYQGLPSADIALGDTLELRPSEKGGFLYTETFQTPRFIRDADIEGFRDLLWEENQTLALRSWNGRQPQAALIYKFAGDGYAAQYPQVSVTVPYLASGSVVTLSIAPEKGGHIYRPLRWYHKISTKGSNPQILRLSTEGDPRFASIRSFRVRIDMIGELRSGEIAAQIDNVTIRADLSP
jgi:hypothetical protein